VVAVEVLEEVTVDVEPLVVVVAGTVALLYQTFNLLGPPQYSRLLPAQSMLHPEVAIPAELPIVLPQ